MDAQCKRTCGIFGMNLELNKQATCAFLLVHAFQGGKHVFLLQLF